MCVRERQVVLNNAKFGRVQKSYWNTFVPFLPCNIMQTVDTSSACFHQSIGKLSAITSDKLPIKHRPSESRHRVVEVIEFCYSQERKKSHVYPFPGMLESEIVSESERESESDRERNSRT